MKKENQPIEKIKQRIEYLKQLLENDINLTDRERDITEKDLKSLQGILLKRLQEFRTQHDVVCQNCNYKWVHVYTWITGIGESKIRERIRCPKCGNCLFERLQISEGVQIFRTEKFERISDD